MLVRTIVWKLCCATRPQLILMQVKSGDKLTAEWHHTLDSKPETDKSDPIDPGHLGPIMVYLAKVDNALTTTVTGLKCRKPPSSTS
jgi:hypothetical protein